MFIRFIEWTNKKITKNRKYWIISWCWKKFSYIYTSYRNRWWSCWMNSCDINIFIRFFVWNFINYANLCVVNELPFGSFSCSSDWLRSFVSSDFSGSLIVFPEGWSSLPTLLCSALSVDAVIGEVVSGLLSFRLVKSR